MIAAMSGEQLTEEALCENVWLIEYVEHLYGTLGLSYKPENIFCLSMLLSAGSESNLRPELLVSAFEKYVCKGIKQVKIHRKELYVKKGTKIILPLDNEALIY
jgi:hypothetical protein